MENKSVISELFTPEELEVLKFTDEELDAIETAELAGKALDVMPDSDAEMDAFFARIEKEFPAGKTFEETMNHFKTLAENDKMFIQQIMAMSAIIDLVEEEPETGTSKVSAAEITKAKKAEITAAQKAKFAAVDKILKSLK